MKCWYCDKQAIYSRRLCNGQLQVVCSAHKIEEENIDIEIMGNVVNPFQEMEK